MTKLKAKRNEESATASGKPLSEATPQGDQFESNRATKKPTDQKTEADRDEADAKPFDFGGLPDRNLKKNLGCG